MKQTKRVLTLCAMSTLGCYAAIAQNISGNIVDAKTSEPLIGAIVTMEGSDAKTVTDVDGKFTIAAPDYKPHTLLIKYIGYQTTTLKLAATKDEANAQPIVIKLQADEQQLKEVTVTAAERKNTTVAMLQAAKNSSFIVNNVSAQEIKLSQDSHAGEVIRRVPGVSLIDDKFVMVRGLSQRYNNVWLNGGAVPSSEADARAFSFDLIPSSQIEGLTIVKAPTAEYPADYSGAFILINTQEIPNQNSTSLTLGANVNDAATFHSFSYAKGSSTDFLGFDNGFRSLHGGIESQLKPLDDNAKSLTDNHLNNDWLLHTRHPLPDLTLQATLNRYWKGPKGQLGLTAALHYNNAYRRYNDMENNLFGVYDYQNDRSNYLRHSVDQQFNHDVRLSGMFNLTALSKSGKHKYQFKNIFNQIGNDRYTWRDGVSAQANLERSAEYFYRSRTAYNTQFTGKHDFGQHQADWSAGYAYANRNQPDRRRYLVDDALESGVYALSTGNDISREWTRLDEHIFSANLNDKWMPSFSNWTPTIKAGAYAEYRTRKYTTRNFIYNWNAYQNNMPNGFRHMDIPQLISNTDNMGMDKLYLIELEQMTNNYRGNNLLEAGYLSAILPFGKLSMVAGARLEHADMELISNTSDQVKSETSRHYRTTDLFPSLAATYKLSDKHQFRMSYGRSINRPEFREISPSVYYDFDLASSVQGNTELRNCYVDNFDLRYEYYPSRSELFSVALFYKHFDSPIEWTYTVTGGTDLVYSYKNARSANNLGVEVDFRKTLDFIGLPRFSWSFNAALISSKVTFAPGSREENRPMQGQSPYLINTGLFYRDEAGRTTLTLLYNRIGKRIIGVGRSEGTTGDNDNARVPDSYEMPRNSIDITASRKFGRHWEAKFSVRDLLAETLYYKQFADVTYSDGRQATVPQVTRSYKPGRNITLQATYHF